MLNRVIILNDNAFLCCMSQWGVKSEMIKYIQIFVLIQMEDCMLAQKAQINERQARIQKIFFNYTIQKIIILQEVQSCAFHLPSILLRIFFVVIFYKSCDFFSAQLMEIWGNCFMVIANVLTTVVGNQIVFLFSSFNASIVCLL